MSARAECSYEELSAEDQWLWDDALDMWHASEVRVASLPAEMRDLVEEEVRRMKESLFMPYLKDLGQVQVEAMWYQEELDVITREAQAELRLRALEAGDEEALRSLDEQELLRMLESRDPRERTIGIRLAPVIGRPV